MQGAESHQIVLESGHLTVEVEPGPFSLDELLGFAVRNNPKRGFLFVSKVLGKHIPVKPSRIRQTHQALAAMLGDLPGPVLFVGMAETATLLGQGVFAEYRALTGRTDLLYVSTTRYPIPGHEVLEFTEPHSHAVEQLLHVPLSPLFAHARTAVLIDDEMTSGTTLQNLMQTLPVQQAVVVTLADWGPERPWPKPTRRVSLLKGRWRFEPNPSFAPPMPPSTPPLRSYPEFQRTVRTGVWEEERLGGLSLQSRGRTLVVGTGEFSYLPYRLALALEQQNPHTYYQSSTRSPIRLGHAVTNAASFADPEGIGLTNYLYNLADYQARYAIYEQPHFNQELSKQIGAHSVVVPELRGS